jgi:hypothetical protein
MKVYFLSSKPCILTLNGAYFGLTDTFERFIDLSPKDNLFAQFTPEDGLPVCFFINESIRFHPPKRCEVYLLKDGIAIYAKDFPPSDMSLKTIAQEREGTTLVTVFQQGDVQVSIENPNGFFLSTLPPSFESSNITFYDNFVILNSPEQLALFNQLGKLLLLEKFTEFKLEKNVLHATLPLSDRLRRVAKCAWEFVNDDVRQTAFSISQEACVNLPFDGENMELSLPTAENIRDELLPYAFFESILIGADYAQFLDDTLQKKASSVKEFLGEFTSVVLTETPNVCGLVRKKSERLFEVDEFLVELNNGKILDVRAV